MFCVHGLCLWFGVFTCFMLCFYVIVSSWYVVKSVGLSRAAVLNSVSYSLAVLFTVILCTVLMYVSQLSELNC